MALGAVFVRSRLAWAGQVPTLAAIAIKNPVCAKAAHGARVIYIYPAWQGWAPLVSPAMTQPPYDPHLLNPQHTHDHQSDDFAAQIGWAIDHMEQNRMLSP
jgi:hypothetical protein